VSVFRGYGVEVNLVKREDFLKVMETLTRIGTPGEGVEFIQACHIFHKGGKYAIMHHNEMHAFDGDKSRLTQEDVEQRNVAVQLLVKWGLVSLPAGSEMSEDIDLGAIRVLQFAEKNNWKIVQRYQMGKGAKTSWRSAKPGYK
jgi:hypothetical protein